MSRRTVVVAVLRGEPSRKAATQRPLLAEQTVKEADQLTHGSPAVAVGIEQRGSLVFTIFLGSGRRDATRSVPGIGFDVMTIK
jgi:hypothetical protein